VERAGQRRQLFDGDRDRALTCEHTVAGKCGRRDRSALIAEEITRRSSSITAADASHIE
jgi:hypothetical protein